MDEERERVVIPKLEALNNIRPKVMAVHKLQERLAEEVDMGQMEESTLAVYREDLELLLQEKMTHVEELRLINADINAIENIIKSAEKVRGKNLDRARRLYDDYQSQKNEVVNQINSNQQIIGHDIKLPFLAPENDPVPPKYVVKLFCYFFLYIYQNIFL